MNGIMKLVASATTAFAFATTATASVTTTALEIATPANVTNDAPAANEIQWFKEATNVLVGADVEGLGSTGITAGQRVDTYMIFLNKIATTSGVVEDGKSFIFSTDILGVFGEANGGDLVATDGLATITSYTNFTARGIENGDDGSFSAGFGNDLLTLTGTNQLDVFFRVTQPGDWVRVAVVAAVPLPAGILLLPFAIGGLAVAGRRRKSA